MVTDSDIASRAKEALGGMVPLGLESAGPNLLAEVSVPRAKAIVFPHCLVATLGLPRLRLSTPGSYFQALAKRGPSEVEEVDASLEGKPAKKAKKSTK